MLSRMQLMAAAKQPNEPVSQSLAPRNMERFAYELVWSSSTDYTCRVAPTDARSMCFHFSALVQLDTKYVKYALKDLFNNTSVNDIGLLDQC